MRDAVRQIKKKLRSAAGFSLAEALTAVLIMLMASSIIAAGIPAATNAYEKVVLASNAEVLLSTAVTALRNEIGTADFVKADEDGSGITYYSGAAGSASRIFLSGTASGDGGGTETEENARHVMVARYVAMPEAKVDGADDPPDPVRLISKEAATADLYVTYESVSYGDGVVVFHDLAVKRESGERVLTERETLSIRVLTGN